MSDRSRDWFAQAEHDLGLARVALEGARYDWACFAAHQAAEKAVKALHLHHRQEAWGHVIARLLRGLRDSPSDDLLDCARVLDAATIPTRYPDSFPEGAPCEHYGRRQGEEAIACADAILGFVRDAMA